MSLESKIEPNTSQNASMMRVLVDKRFNSKVRVQIVPKAHSKSILSQRCVHLFV